MIRLALLLSFVIGAGLFLSPAVFAADETHNGKVVTAGGGRLEIAATDGDTEDFTVDPDAKIVRNDRKATLEDLKAGDVVTVKTARKDGKIFAVNIVATAPE